MTKAKKKPAPKGVGKPSARMPSAGGSLIATGTEPTRAEFGWTAPRALSVAQWQTIERTLGRKLASEECALVLESITLHSGMLRALRDGHKAPRDVRAELRRLTTATSTEIRELADGLSEAAKAEIEAALHLATGRWQIADATWSELQTAASAAIVPAAARGRKARPHFALARAVRLLWARLKCGRRGRMTDFGLIFFEVVGAPRSESQIERLLEAAAK